MTPLGKVGAWGEGRCSGSDMFNLGLSWEERGDGAVEGSIFSIFSILKTLQDGLL